MSSMRDRVEGIEIVADVTDRPEGAMRSKGLGVYVFSFADLLRDLESASCDPEDALVEITHSIDDTHVRIVKKVT